METGDESEEKVSVNLSYPFEYPMTSMTQHVKPLYIKATFDEIQMNQVLVDNGTAVNLGFSFLVSSKKISEAGSPLLHYPPIPYSPVSHRKKP